MVLRLSWLSYQQCKHQKIALSTKLLQVLFNKILKYWRHLRKQNTWIIKKHSIVSCYCLVYIKVYDINVNFVWYAELINKSTQETNAFGRHWGNSYHICMGKTSQFFYYSISIFYLGCSSDKRRKIINDHLHFIWKKIYVTKTCTTTRLLNFETYSRPSSYCRFLIINRYISYIWYPHKIDENNEVLTSAW